jgi:hypothetical protein
MRWFFPPSVAAVSAALVLLAGVPPATAHLVLGPEQLVQSDTLDLSVSGYSVPSWVDWNEDGLQDLVVGEGGGDTFEGKVRVYLNQGAPGAPDFPEYFYAQSDSGDLSVPGSG